ncbi:hypothetical protein DTO280E4_6548 [Paecilomyces variotii]|nr:hypothetical protein DTO280E4_6548 [Paecilomyces variotii]
MLGTQNLNIFAASTDHSEDVEIWITEAKSPAENVDLIIMMNPFLLLPGIWFTGVEPWSGFRQKMMIYNRDPHYAQTIINKYPVNISS